MARTNKLQKFVMRDDMFDGKFSPTQEFAQETYAMLNRYIFDNGLKPVPLVIKRTRGYWGITDGRVDTVNDEYRVHNIRLCNKYPVRAMFVATLAHEMIHQFQWDILSNERYDQGKPPIMSHGPSFFAWKPALAEYHIPLTKVQ